MTARRAILSAILLLLIAGPAGAHPGKLDGSGCHRESKSDTRHCHGAAPVRDASRPPRAGDEGVFYGPVVRVVDGDSLEARVQGVVMEFRLAEIDAPEYDQPYGSQAREELIRLIGGQTLVMVPFDTDSYGRTVAHLWAGDVQLNRELVERGAAWFLSDYTNDDSLYHVEQQARAAKLGLWALPSKDRIEPWEWRKRKRTRRR